MNEIARLTLVFGLEREDHRDEAEIKADFEAHFDEHDFPGVGKWLWGKHTIIKKPLLNLLAIPLEHKEQVKTAVDADIDFEALSCSGHMLTATMDQDDSAIQCVKTIMIAFYESILRDQKVPGHLVGELADFDRQGFLRSFLHSQEIKVCPGCDGSPPSRDIYADRIRGDVDHFLPKSKYPVLAVHPLNLVPLCKTCNQDYKGEHDALSDTVDAVSDVTDLEHIFHPYLRPACDEVDVTVSWCIAEAKQKLTVTPRADSPTGWARVHSLEYILSLESRWNGDLIENRLDGLIKQGLMYSTQLERTDGRIDRAQIRVKFDTVCRTIPHGIGAIPGSVAANAYAVWLANDEKAQNERNGLWLQALNVAEPTVRQKSQPTYF